jgi:DNA helicase-2/ATP-dependent DNA helicase PcrA
VVIIPAYLVKGLEFDVAIVVNVDHKTYANTEDDARLLYVAITRPLHQLYLFWVGEISLLLEHAVSWIE